MERKLRITLIIFGMTVVMFQFQNCAKVSPASFTDHTVQLIDNYSKLAVQFPATSIQLFDETHSVPLNGLCNRVHEGAAVEWSVLENDHAIAAGQSVCASGQFNFDVRKVKDWVCGVPVQVNAYLVDGSGAAMFVTKRCQPLASQTVGDSVSQFGQPQSCSLEYRLNGSEQGLCQVACYQQNILASLEDRPISECEPLRQKLSGQ